MTDSPPVMRTLLPLSFQAARYSCKSCLPSSLVVSLVGFKSFSRLQRVSCRWRRRSDGRSKHTPGQILSLRVWDGLELAVFSGHCGESR